MLLYLIRHGEAEETTKPDAERDLTQNGKEQVEKLAAKITSTVEAPTLLLSSPFKRAVQTAEAFRDGWDIPLEIVDWLLPWSEPSQVLEELKNLPQQSIALVGHLPCLGLLLGTLVWGLPPKEVALPKAGVCCLSFQDWEPAAAKLKWLLSPDSMGKLWSNVFST